MRVPGKVRQLQYLELLGWEGIKGLSDLVALRVPPRLHEDLARLGAWSQGFDLFLHPAPARLGTDLVYAAVANYGEQPNPNAASIRTIAASAPPEFQERVLRQVFGSPALPHHPIGQGEGSVAVAVVEDGERLGVVLPDERDQILVRQEQVPSPPTPYHRTHCSFAEVGKLSCFVSNFC